MEDNEFFKIPSTEEIQAINYGRTYSSEHARRISNIIGSFSDPRYSDFGKKAEILSKILENAINDKAVIIISDVELPEELAEAKSTIRRRAKLLSEHLSGENGLIPQIKAQSSNRLSINQLNKLREIQGQWMSLCANENISTDQFEK